jgi:hypothetical protein
MRIRHNDADPTGSGSTTTAQSLQILPGAELTQRAAERGRGAAETSASYARQSGHIFQTVLKPVGTGLKSMLVRFSLSHFIQIPTVLKPVGTGLKPMLVVGYSGEE